MSISATYADRTDLSQLLKWRFTLEEKIEYSIWARALFRWYLFLPKWTQDTIVAFSIIVGGAFFLLAYLCESVVQGFLKDEDGVERGEGIGLTFFFFALCVVAYFHLYVGVAFIVAALLPMAMLWFSHLMSDYEVRLQKRLIS